MFHKILLEINAQYIESQLDYCIDHMLIKMNDAWIMHNKNNIDHLAEEIMKNSANDMQAELNRYEKNLKEQNKSNNEIQKLIADEKPKAERKFKNLSELEAKERYRAIFIKDHAPKLKKQLKNQLKELPLDQILKNAVARHSWFIQKNELGNEYLTEMVGKLFRYLVEYRVCFQGSEPLSLEHFPLSILNDPDNFKLMHLSDKKINNLWEAFPIAKASELYADSLDDFNSWANTLSSDKPKVLHEPSRIDIYRLLLNRQKMIAISDNDDSTVKTTYHLPVNIDEIPTLNESADLNNLKLSRAQLTNAQTLLVNINTNSQTEPVWILLKKQEIGKAYGWDVFLPEKEVFEKLSHHKFIDLDNKLHTLLGGHVTYQHVEYQTNIANNGSNDNKQMKDLTHWHAVLFGKILPHLTSKDDPNNYRNNYRELKATLPEYRKNVSTFMLYQHMVEKGSKIKSVPSKADELFKLRKPFSDKNLDDILLANEKTSITHLIPEKSINALNIVSENILNYFDTGIFQTTGHTPPSHNATTLQIKKKEDNSLPIFDALYTMYYSPFSQLVIPDLPYIDKDNNKRETFNHLFNYNTNLRVFKLENPHSIASDKEAFEYGFHCAARNRFLAAFNINTLKEAEDDLSKRITLWKTTGNQLFDYFKQHGTSVDLDFIKSADENQKKWRENGYEADLVMQKDPTWIFNQFALMGDLGLDTFFTSLSEYASRKEQGFSGLAPNLACTFNLNGNGLSDRCESYIKKLTQYISEFDKKTAPLFSALSLIMPNKTNESIAADGNRKAVLALIKTIDHRNKTLKIHHKENALIPGEDVTEFHLYNFANDKDAIFLLEELSKIEDLQTQIHIPEWDRAVYKDPEQIKLKVKYRSLQNKIAENQRQNRQADLAINTQLLHDNNDPSLKAPKITLRDRKAKIEQKFEGAEVIFPLTTEKPGIQQQFNQELQEGIAQSFQEEKQEEQEQAKQQEQQVEVFIGNENELIDRSNLKNIDEKIKERWLANISKVSENINLEEIFSLFVGSDQSGVLNTIEKIDVQAMEKLIEHARLFLMGVNKDNLPPGFFLNSTQDRKLVLRFSDVLEKDVMEKREKCDVEKRDPFQIVLHTPITSKKTRGDFRQMQAMIGDEKTTQEELQTLWRYLATEDKDSDRLAAINNIFEDNSVDDMAALTAMQDYEIKKANNTFKDIKSISKPGDETTCLNILKTWAKNNHATPSFIEALFGQGKNQFTLENLKAFGQLFNYYDSKTNLKNNGSQNWLLLANKMFTTFGADHFSIWKKCCLDVSDNWSIFLEKDEIAALTLSMKILEGEEYKSYQAIWWKLVEAQKRNIGHLRYADIWYAFEKVLSFIDKNNLTFNDAAIINYLDKATNFNGQAFLNNLYFVLEKTKNKMDGRIIQQNILNNIDKIDWNQNGYYHACRYDDYPDWHPSLQLTKFTSPTSLRGYEVSWDNLNLPIDLPVLQALRFAGQRMKYNAQQLTKLQNLLEKSPLAHAHNAPILRIFMLSLSLGVDELDNVTADTLDHVVSEMNKNPDFIHLINSLFKLDADLLRDSFKLSFADIPKLIKAVDNDLLILMKKHGSQKLSDVINICGHALEYFKNDTDGFKKFLTQMKNNQLEIGLLQICPWLIKDKNATPITIDNEKYPTEIEKLQDQLRTIDFSKSSTLPTYQQIRSAYVSIQEAENPEAARAKRREIVTNFIKNGCEIRYQDAAFHKLNKDEVTYFNQFLDNKLKGTFKDRNKKLCEKLVGYLAISDQLRSQQQIEELCISLVNIANKTHFDELSQVVGLLITKAKNNLGIYSSPQLKVWLEMFSAKQNKELVHYPVTLLEQILDHAINKPSLGLMHADLIQLHSKTDETQKISAILLSSADLPPFAKAFIIKLALREDTEFVDKIKTILKNLNTTNNKEWLVATITLIEDQGKAALPLLDELTKLDHGKALNVDTQELWQHAQIQLVQLLNDEKLKNDQLQNYLSLLKAKDNVENTAYLRIVMVLANGHELNKDQIEKIINTLAENKWNREQYAKLAQYYRNKPFLSAQTLYDLLSQPEHIEHVKESADALINYFEMVIQNIDQDKKLKRHYITDEDREGLLRVLSGFKIKGKGFVDEDHQKLLMNLLSYSNSYSEVELLAKQPTDELQKNILRVAKTLRDLKASSASEEKQAYASAELLALMREMLLRKTGLWANHTQMLDLLYAALYNDDNLLHQIHTGEGKSIITFMRTGYLALNGYVIDIFSAKESLAERDYEEFAHVFNAIGIKHGYVNAKSKAEDYKASSFESTIPNSQGIGGINYATIGNNSLADCAQVYSDEDRVKVPKEKHIAWLDECDHILRFEKTQFNFSSSLDSNIYNMDEWVYRITYQFYLDHRNDFQEIDGVIYIKRNKDLKALCEKLQIAAEDSPQQSNFMKDYIFPALDEHNVKAIEKRDLKLKQLLTAAHIAHHLKADIEYCVQNEIKALNDDTSMAVRFAKVVIANQISEGSTYSDLVHQFLHARLNHNAQEEGDIPNFFIDPESQIALSRNAKSLLIDPDKYGKLEGCSGTVGNLESLQFYQDIYGIHHVIKLPTHHESKIEYKGVIFCENEEEQVKLISAIMNNTQKNGEDNAQAMLITAENDAHVTQLYSKLKKQKLTVNPDKFHEDTLQKGISEKKMVKEAEKPGAVLVSSRMGRGTNIKPPTKKGLREVRTYAAPKEIVDQELGRVGRFGANGEVVEILNYEKIQADVKQLQDQAQKYKLKDGSLPHDCDFDKIYQEQKDHLLKKLKKHENSSKWDWIKKNDYPNMEKWLDGVKIKTIAHISSKEKDINPKMHMYITMRSMIELRKNIERKQEEYLRRKEDLIAALSKHIQDALTIYHHSPQHEKLRTAWSACRDEIDNAWNKRLMGKKVDNEEIYQAFLQQVNTHWRTMSADFVESNKVLKDNLACVFDLHKIKVIKKTPVLAVQQVKKSEKERKLEQAAMEQVTTLYQYFTAGIKRTYLSNHLHGDALKAQENTMKLAFSVDNQLINLYRQAQLASITYRGEYEHSKTLFENLSALFAKNSAFYFTAESYAQFFSLLQHNQENRMENKENNKKQDHAVISSLSSLIKKIENWVPDTKTPSIDEIRKFSKLMEITTRVAALGYSEPNVKEFIEILYDVLHENFWEKFTAVKDIELILSSDPAVTRLLINHVNKEEITYYINLLIKNDELEKQKRINYNSVHNHTEQFVNYLRNHENALNKKPSIIKSVANLTLNDMNYDNYLPHPECLKEFTDEEQSLFWRFLENRMPIKKETCDGLIELLNSGIKDRAYKEKIFDPLIKMPAYVPLDAIYQQLQSTNNLANDETKAMFIKLQQAGFKMNAFMYKAGLIEKEQMYSPTLDHRRPFNSALVAFAKMDPKDANDQFDYAKQLLDENQVKNTQIEQLTKQAYTKFLSESFPDFGRMTENIKKLLQSVHRFIEDYEHKLKLEKNYETSHEWHAFINFKSSHMPLFSEIKRIIDNCNKELTRDQMQQAMECFEHIKKLKEKPGEDMQSFTTYVNTLPDVSILTNDFMIFSTYNNHFHSRERESVINKHILEKLTYTMFEFKKIMCLYVEDISEKTFNSLFSRFMKMIKTEQDSFSNLIHQIGQLDQEYKPQALAALDDTLSKRSESFQPSMNDFSQRLDDTKQIQEKMKLLSSEKIKKQIKDLYFNNDKKYTDTPPEINKRFLSFLTKVLSVNHADEAHIHKIQKMGVSFLQEENKMYLIKDAAELDKAWTAFDDAVLFFNHFKEGDKTLAKAKLFDSITDSQERREKILHYLNNGVITFNDAEFSNFKQACWTAYDELVDKSFDLKKETISSKTIKGRDKLKDYFTKIVIIAKEVPKVRDKFINGFAQNEDTMMQELNEFFAKYKEIYRGFWFKSSDRNSQYKKLFIEIDNVKTLHSNKSDYLTNVLVKICDSQQEMLNTDVANNARRNLRKHSRLYDISMHMFIKVAHTLLTGDIADEDKKQVHKLLQKQLIHHIKVLLMVLPDDKMNDLISGLKLSNPELAEKVTSWRKKSHWEKGNIKSIIGVQDKLELNANDLMAIKKQLDTGYNKILPKNLLYMIDNIDHLFADLPNARSQTKSEPNSFLRPINPSKTN